ncbi:MAG: hypothetical protein H7177_01065 [Rhizobacter sp.]|nr:hypothetical protein [Bacteriovorax sp.]
MNTLLEKLALALFLLMGLSAYSTTHAARSDILNEEVVAVECPISGHVSLRLNGPLENGRLDGYIDSQFVFWPVTNGTVTGFINGHYFNLKIEPERNEYLLSGWIGTNYIRWTSFGGQFNEWVYCH